MVWKKVLLPNYAATLESYVLYIMCVLTGIVVFWVSFIAMLLLDPINMHGLS